MRILMVSTNRLSGPHPIIPLGLCQVAESAESAGHTVRLLDLCFEPLPLSRIREAIRRSAPDAIGLSVRNIDNCDSSSPESYTAGSAAYVAEVRRTTSAPVVLGGPAVSMVPDLFLNLTDADRAVVGDGETAFPKLLDELVRGRASDERIIRAEVGETKPSGLPLSMLGRLDLRRYAAYGAPMSIQTKRGCAMRCSYCTYPTIEGSTYRMRPPSQIADEIEEIASMQLFRSVEFVDSIFNYPLNHAIGVCDELARRGNRMPLQTSELNPSSAPPELFRLMKRAGFVGFVSTLESFSDEVLVGLNKGYTSREVARTVEDSRSADMARMWVFMFGGPGETEQTAAETIRFIEKRIGSRDLVFIASGVRIYPGTELERTALCEGVLTGDEDLLEPTFYFSPLIGRERLEAMLRGSMPAGSRTILLSDMDWPMLPVMQRIHTMLHLKPPYWRYARPAMAARRALGRVTRWRRKPSTRYR